MALHERKINKSHLTAIGRKKPSRPATWLEENGFVRGKVVDFGCGRGMDERWLNTQGYHCVGYDPNHRNDVAVLDKRYDTVLCSFVLNVVTRDIEPYVLNDIKKLIKKGGKAYITVRRDMKVPEYTTKRGTYQRMVELNLPVVKKHYDYCIYEMEG